MKHVPLILVLLMGDSVTSASDSALGTGTSGSATDSPEKGRSQYFWEDHARGWHWYETQSQEGKPQETQSQKTSAPKKPGVSKKSLKRPAQDSKSNASTILKQYKEELVRRFDEALVNPTEDNLKAYIQMQKDMMERSSRFAQNWQKVILYHPELDYTAANPVMQAARHVAYAEENRLKKSKIKALQKTHGLFFFFKGNCPYCHEFAPIVKAFSEQYGWEILPVSLDGGTTPLFPRVMPDNGASNRLNVTHVPSLFAVNPSSGQVLPLSHGMVSLEEIESRLMLLMEEREAK